jgi:uncharacterized membrane protein YphA (DoxX/SURF4 family)
MTIDARRGHVLALLRMLMGGIFVAVWADNLSKGLYWPDGYADFLQDFTRQAELGFYKDFVDNVAIPNAAVFGYTQLIVELVVMGLFLLSGFLTPVAGIVAAGFSLNLLLASLGNPTEWPGTYLLMIAVSLAVAFGQAGRTWGIDALLARRRHKPRLPVY